MKLNATSPLEDVAGKNKKGKNISCFIFNGVTNNLLPTVSGLAKVAIFTTNVDAENQCLINRKCVCEALNRHFCQARVSGSLFLSVKYFYFLLSHSRFNIAY